MSGPREQVIGEVLAGLTAALSEFRDSIGPINDQGLTTPLRDLHTAFEPLLAALTADPHSLADDVATMRSLIDRTVMPAMDPALGDRSHDRRTARGALGALLIATHDARKHLESIGLRPTTPEVHDADEALVPALVLEQQVAAIISKLDIVARDVAGLKRDETGADRSVQQLGLITIYAEQVEPRIALINTEVSGEVIDLAALARLTAFLASTTRSFAATVAGMAATASAGLKAAAPRLRRGVTAFVRIVRSGADAARGWIARRELVVPQDKPRPDPPFDEEDVRRRILSGESIPPSWISQILFLDLRDSEIDDIAPLASLTALTYLNLTNTQVHNLTPLTNLTSLNYLYLMNTPIDDVAPLKNHFALTVLSLWGTKVIDLRPLVGLTDLKELNLSRTSVVDLTPLAGLNALTRLHLTEVKANNFKSLSGLIALTDLKLWGTEFSDLTLLAGLTALTSLDLDGTHVTDIAALANLTDLTSLDLRNTQASDLAPLAGLTSLTNLNLNYTTVSDLAPLAGLSALTSLNLVSTKVSDLNPLADLNALTSLDLRFTGIDDLTPIRNLPRLDELNLLEAPLRLEQDWPGWRWNPEASALLHAERRRTRGLEE